MRKLFWSAHRVSSSAPALTFAIAQAATLALLLLPQSSQALGFDEALQRILERDPTLLGQRAEARAARERNRPARLAFWPTLTGDVSETRLSVPVPSRSGLATVTLNQNIFHFGADLAQRESARAEDLRQDALEDLARLAAETRAVDALVGEIQSLRQVDVNRRTLATQQSSLEIAQARYRRGLLAQEEVDKVRIDTDNARARLADAETQALNAHAQLGVLLGDDSLPANALQLDWPWRDRFATPVVAAELTERPDWRVADARVTVEDAKASRATRLQWPAIDVRGAYGGFQTEGQWSAGWTATLGLSVPLFDRWAGLSEARAQSETLAAARIAREQVQREARAEWQASRQTFEIAWRSARDRDDTLKVAQRLYAQNLKRFELGRVDANELAVDQSRLFSAELLAVDGWSAAHKAYVKLCHASGRTLAACFAAASSGISRSP